MSRTVAKGAAAAAFVVSGAVHGAVVSGQGTWETTLQARDLFGSRTTAEAYYDTVLDVTWLRDANAIAGSGYDQDGAGTVSWDSALAWVDSLAFKVRNVSYGDWRLPRVTDTGPTGCNVSHSGGGDCGFNVQTVGQDDTIYSELAHLFYVTLGNEPRSYIFPSSPPYIPQSAGGLTNAGPFTNVQSGDGNHVYWFSLEYDTVNPEETAFSPGYYAWAFDMAGGYQSNWVKEFPGYAWAVHDGDVGRSVVPPPNSDFGRSVVPLPGALWLFGSALIGLVALSRRWQAPA